MPFLSLFFILTLPETISFEDKLGYLEPMICLIKKKYEK